MLYVHCESMRGGREHARRLVVFSLGARSNMSGFTLFVPSLGLGNVCQLALDLLLNTALALDPAAVRALGPLPSPAVLPAAGPWPFSGAPRTASGAPSSTPPLCHAAELFAIDAARAVVLAQRAPAGRAAQEALVADVLAWAAAAGVARVVVVGAAHRAASLAYTAGAATRFVAFDTEEALAGVPALGGRAAAAGAVSPPPALLALGREAGSGQHDVEEEAAAAAQAGLYEPSAPLGRDADEDDGSSSGRSVGGELATAHPLAVGLTARLFAAAPGVGYAPVYFRRALSRGLHAREGTTTTTSSAATYPGYLPVGVLTLFTAEGDNLVDAAALAAAITGLWGGWMPSAPPATPAADAGAASGGGSGSGGTVEKKKKKKKTKADPDAPLPVTTPAPPGACSSSSAATSPSSLTFLAPPYFAALHGPELDVATGLRGW